MKVEISPHARRWLAMRMISEELVFNGVVDPDRVLFDRESGYFIAVKKVNNMFLIIAYLLFEERVRIAATFQRPILT